jgi:hypothetical protein
MPITLGDNLSHILLGRRLIPQFKGEILAGERSHTSVTKNLNQVLKSIEI